MDFQWILLPLFFVWALGSVFLLFQRKLDWLWKISSVLLFFLYAVWFREAILASYEAYSRETAAGIVKFFQASWHVLGLTLLAAWPMVLWSGVFSRAKEEANRRLKLMTLVTLFYWAFRFMDFFTPPFLKDLLETIGRSLQPFLKGMSNPPV